MDYCVRPLTYSELAGKLDTYFMLVKRQILQYQNAVSGLFVSNASDGNVANVRDNLYCVLAIWALSQGYKKIDKDAGRTVLLQLSAVKCMRTILHSWMMQADRLEHFKKRSSAEFALRLHLNVQTGEPINDLGNANLQIGTVSLYLLVLAQMTVSGCRCVLTQEESRFVQNIVFYVERAYRIPDYGVWERGSKYNNGQVELHASSVGKAKAALEVMNGFNVFNDQGSGDTVIYVDVDAHSRNRIILADLLPAESASKQSDATLLPTLSWPAFAMHVEQLRAQTLQRVTETLEGRYGFKRFLRDGYKTVVEDPNRLHYEPGEMKKFENIENEWPTFFAHMIIEKIFANDWAGAVEYNRKLRPLLIESENGLIMPRFFYVPRDLIELERRNPGSQPRVADTSFNLWGQAVYFISQLLFEAVISVNDLDPIQRRLLPIDRPVQNMRHSQFVGAPLDLRVQVVLLAESSRLQALLSTYGIQSQTPHQVEPVQIWSPSELVRVHERLGECSRLGVSGRPTRPFGILSTSKFYRIKSQLVLCYPHLFEIDDFYIAQDTTALIGEIKADLAFLASWWRLKGRPTYCILIREDLIKSPNVKQFIDFLAELRGGSLVSSGQTVNVQLGRAQNYVQSACLEHLDFLNSCEEERVSADPEVDVDHDASHAEGTCKRRHFHFRRFVGRDEVVRVKSLQDLVVRIGSDTGESAQQQDVYIPDIDKMSSSDLVTQYRSLTSLAAQADVLCVLAQRHSLGYIIDGHSVEELLGGVCRHAGELQKWAVVRLCSGLLKRVVASLAPGISSILVHGKQITIGVHGHGEFLIDKPYMPNEIKERIYTHVYPFDVYQACLQQELIINISKLVSTETYLFDGLKRLRIGWIVQAMRLELVYAKSTSLVGRSAEEEDDTEGNKFISSARAPALYNLSPTAVYELLRRTLATSATIDRVVSSGSSSNLMSSANEQLCKLVDLRNRPPILMRQLDGGLSRVHKDFAASVWVVLERSERGIELTAERLSLSGPQQRFTLAQQPTLSDMEPADLVFQMCIEDQLLRGILDPAYRAIIVETLLTLSYVLKRNPEIRFVRQPMQIDRIVLDALTHFGSRRRSSDATPSSSNSPRRRDRVGRRPSWPGTLRNVSHAVHSICGEPVDPELVEDFMNLHSALYFAKPGASHEQASNPVEDNETTTAYLVRALMEYVLRYADLSLNGAPHTAYRQDTLLRSNSSRNNCFVS